MSVGLFLGAAFVYISDVLITRAGVVSPQDFGNQVFKISQYKIHLTIAQNFLALHAAGLNSQKYKEESPSHSSSFLLGKLLEKKMLFLSTLNFSLLKKKM